MPPRRRIPEPAEIPLPVDPLGEPGDREPSTLSVSGESENHWKMEEKHRLSEDSTHFYNWKTLANILLTATTLITIVNGTEPCPDTSLSSTEEIRAWKRRDGRAMAQLSSFVSLGLLGQLDISSARSMWLSIENRFQMSGTASIMLAHDELTSKHIGSTETMSKHIAELRRLRTAYFNSGGTLTATEWRIIIVKSLKHRWAQFRPVLVLLDDAEKIINYLIIEARTLESSQAIEEETAMSASSKSQRRRYNGPPCTHCGRKSHGVDNCYAPGGKLENQAPAWYKPPANMRGSDQKANAVSAPGGSTSETARMAYMTNHPDLGPLLDSGATSHMVNSKANLGSYIEFDQPLLIGSAKSGTYLRSLGRGILTLQLSQDSRIQTLSLSDVLYVPELDTDLISVSKLEDADIQLHFRQSRCFLAKGTQELGYAERSGSLYYLRAEYVPPEGAYLTSAQQDLSQGLDIWHRRFGHMSEARIRSMVNHGAITGIQITGPKPTGQCEACILSKQSAQPSPARDSRADRPFGIVHSDILFFGSTSFGGAKYGLSFIDEASGFTWVYAINDKTADTILAHFRNLDTWVETQFATRILALHSDNGGEYVNKSMSEYLASRGISHRTIAPHRHEMNGIAERLNRTAGDAVRAMLIAAHLPNGYWAEAYHCWAYLRNRSTLSFLPDGTTPFEVIYGSKPDVGHLRVFGSVAYTRIPPDKRRKLDPKSERGTLVGYYDDAAYRIMRPDKSIIKSKDVIFDEGLGSRTLNPTHTDTVAPAPVTTDDISETDLDQNLTPPSVDPFPSRVTSPVPGSPPAPASIPTVRRSARLDPTARTRNGKGQVLGSKYLTGPISAANATPSIRIIAGISVPRHFAEASRSPQASQWMKAASYELGKLLQHDVWVEVPRPIDTHVIQGMWVFNIKEKPGAPLEYRMRWVARGDSQVEGEFGEIHAASGDYTVARLICALSAVENGTLSVNDISSAYLHSQLDLDRPIYVEYPTGFSPLIPGSVCQLKKALYGLKQGARAWQDEFQSTMSSRGFNTLVTAPSAFRRSDKQGETIAGTHVDDIVSIHITAPPASQTESERFKSDLGSKYEFKTQDLSKKTKLLGWNLAISPELVTISVESKIQRIAERYGLVNARPASTPMAIDALKTFASDKSEPITESFFPYRNAVGELMWLATTARPDIAFAAQVLARYLISPTHCHCIAVKRVIRYLVSTQHIGLNYSKSSTSSSPIGFCDADWGRDPSDRRSVSGYVFTLANGAIDWKVKRQLVVALSTAEAEYLSASQATRESIWLRNFFSEIDRPLNNAGARIYTDNQAVISMSLNPVQHNRTKHIDIPVHHIRDEVKKGRVSFTHIPGSDNPADIFTKPLPRDLHYKCMRAIGLF